MTQQHAETLTQLLREHVGDGRHYTYRAFLERAVDPETQYSPSRNTVWKVVHGQEIKVNPPLIRALAAGLGIRLERVQSAAIRQYIGYQVGDPFRGDGEPEGDAVVRVAYAPGVTADDLPNTRKFIEESRQDAQENT